MSTNPRRHHRRRRNPVNYGGGKFLELSHKGHRRRNPVRAGDLTQGADIMDFGVAAAAFWATDLIGTELGKVTGTTTTDPLMKIVVKVLSAVGLGLLAEETLQRGAAAVMGAGLNATMAIADLAAGSLGTVPPFPTGMTAAPAIATANAGLVATTGTGTSTNATVGGL